jgi:hypothetical protein
MVFIQHTPARQTRGAGARPEPACCVLPHAPASAEAVSCSACSPFPRRREPPPMRCARPLTQVGRSPPGVITLTQPKVPEAKIRGSQKGVQWVILGIERVPGVLKSVQKGPMGPPRPRELSAPVSARRVGSRRISTVRYRCLLRERLENQCPAGAGRALRGGALAAWGDNSVSGHGSCSRANGSGTSAGAFPMALSLCGEGPRGPRRGAEGSCGTPGTPWVSSPVEHPPHP